MILIYLGGTIIHATITDIRWYGIDIDFWGSPGFIWVR